MERELGDVTTKFEEILNKKKNDKLYIEDLEKENDHLKFL
jgi:hypothetical protein